MWKLEESLLTHTEPEWGNFQREHLHRGSTRSLESRYAAGLYNYVLGCWLEMRLSREAGQRFEEALGQLRPFSTMMAHTARCIIAIKLNAFGLLKYCGPASGFYEANVFFNEGLASFLNCHPRLTGRSFERGLWVDDFTEELMKALSSLRSRNEASLNQSLALLRKSQYSNESNNRDKLILLEARVAKAFEDLALAQKAYRHLIHHPTFGEEAKRCCE